MDIFSIENDVYKYLIYIKYTHSPRYVTKQQKLLVDLCKWLHRNNNKKENFGSQVIQYCCSLMEKNVSLAYINGVLLSIIKFQKWRINFHDNEKRVLLNSGDDINDQH